MQQIIAAQYGVLVGSIHESTGGQARFHRPPSAEERFGAAVGSRIILREQRGVLVGATIGRQFAMFAPHKTALHYSLKFALTR